MNVDFPIVSKRRAVCPLLHSEMAAPYEGIVLIDLLLGPFLLAIRFSISLSSRIDI